MDLANTGLKENQTDDDFVMLNTVLPKSILITAYVLVHALSLTGTFGSVIALHREYLGHGLDSAVAARESKARDQKFSKFLFLGKNGPSTENKGF